MISVVMPYWRRPDALTRTLQNYKELYSDLLLEIIIVDDGSPEPATMGGKYPWPVSIIRLPRKQHALNPCFPFNAGVSAASGEVLVITNPEVIHRTPILKRMADELLECGDSGYVAAACQATNGSWYCHTTKMKSDKEMGRAPSPRGAGLHFCAMMGTALYESVGGFSEEYRAGQGFEDNDFLWKLHAAGAHFRILDDCVTEHADCPRTVWAKGGHAANRKIFEDKWLTSRELQN